MLRPATPETPPVGEPDPDAPREAPSLAYIPALDGVRAFAVVGVMAYHGGIPWLPAGFLGVDAFFVLSGFLITSLLVSEWERIRTIALGAFWARRARRLLPALLLLLVFVVLYARFVTPAGTYPGLRLDSLSTLFYVANWHFILVGSNYFDQTSLPSLLTHTWSLSVEEQFYVLWPLVVLGILKFTGRLWVLLAVSVAGALASATEMALLFRHGVSTTRLYYGTDTHGQCLLVGTALASALALFAQRRRQAPDGVPGWAVTGRGATVGLSFVGAAGFVGAAALWWRTSYSGAFLWEGGFLVAALATAAVLVCVVCVQRSWLASALSVRPLRYLGRISYGLYLWHYPLFQWIDDQRSGVSGYPLFALRCAVTLAVATVSFYAVERHSPRNAVPTVAGPPGGPVGGGLGDRRGAGRHRDGHGGRGRLAESWHRPPVGQGQHGAHVGRQHGTHLERRALGRSRPLRRHRGRRRDLGLRGGRDPRAQARRHRRQRGPGL